MSEVLVEVVRGPLAETLHRGDIAVVDASGRLLYAAGDPTAKVTYWRSSAKPFQAMPLVYTGAAAQYGLESEDLALACASHNGEEVHTRRAAAVLERLGLGAEALQCGVHDPYDKPTARELIRRGEDPTTLHHNCSGKHSGMLTLAHHLGADPAGYLAADHPVQRVIRENVAAVTGLAAAQTPLGVDGCGVPTFGMSVYHMALAYARLADPMAIPDQPGEGVELPAGVAAPDPSARRSAAAAVRDAMMAHPYLVAGRNRFDTDLMAAFPGRVVAKSGAAGVFCMAILPEAVAQTPAFGGARCGIGIAVKMEDGAFGAAQAGSGGLREVAAMAALEQLGLLGLLGQDEAAREQLQGYGPRPLLNVAGRPVGEQRAVFRLRQG